MSKSSNSKRRARQQKLTHRARTGRKIDPGEHQKITQAAVEARRKAKRQSAFLERRRRAWGVLGAGTFVITSS